MKSVNSSPTSETPRLRVGLKDVDRETFSLALQEKTGKKRVSIMLDEAVIAFFKAKAGQRGYQTLINHALHQTMKDEQLEVTLRRIIREEMQMGSLNH